MRNELRPLCGQTRRFVATIQKKACRAIGYREGSPIYATTLVLEHVERADTGQKVASHLWLDEVGELAENELLPGDIIGFDARVKNYRKANGWWDYGLREPTNVDVLKTAV